ncbi:hypothetical protein AA106555_0583 [Neokomagataea thailandica NBRC 106555]|uniref:Transposase n=1 Tax=Neokomagataea thailandica NBRC 106555 TaxID=1223520 RepID=A0ABQ0QNI9_9PROT|nr:hypothetical protein AA106555_0583 [Neokomagataea thailandica NBRC 106555]
MISHTQSCPHPLPGLRVWEKALRVPAIAYCNGVSIQVQAPCVASFLNRHRHVQIRHSPRDEF